MPLLDQGGIVAEPGSTDGDKQWILASHFRAVARVGVDRSGVIYGSRNLLSKIRSCGARVLQ